MSAVFQCDQCKTYHKSLNHVQVGWGTTSQGLKEYASGHLCDKCYIPFEKQARELFKMCEWERPGGPQLVTARPAPGIHGAN